MKITHYTWVAAVDIFYNFPSRNDNERWKDFIDSNKLTVHTGEKKENKTQSHTIADGGCWMDMQNNVQIGHLLKW